MELAFEKTKALILYGPRKRNSVTFKIRNSEIIPSKELKYLGVILDGKGTFEAHMKYATDKAGKSVAALSKLMPNVGGPTGRTRKILLNRDRLLSTQVAVLQVIASEPPHRPFGTGKRIPGRKV